MEPFLQRSPMVLVCHATIQIIDNDGIDIPQRKMPLSTQFHDTDTPVYIG